MEARVDLVCNNSNFIVGMSQADAAQKKLAGSWERNVGALFRRSPFARAEQALTDFALNASSGNVVGAFQGLAQRFSGLGLAASVGVAVGIAAFKKFSDQVGASQKAVADINRELSHPASVQGDLGSGIAGKIEADAKLLATLQAKSGTLGGRISEMLEHPADSGKALSPEKEREMRRYGFTSEQIDSMRQNSAENQRRRDLTSAQKAQEAIEERISQLTARRADFEERIGNAKVKGLNGNKLGAALDQNRLSFAQSRAELLERAFSESQRPGRHNVLEDFANFSKSLTGASNLRGAQDAVAQRAEFQEAVKGFNPRSAALTEDFLREKMAADPNAPGMKQMQLRADQLRLFRENAKLDEMKDIDSRSISVGPGARLFQDNLRQKIGEQQQVISDQTKRVFGEQKDVSDHGGGIETRLDLIAAKMDEYWK